MTLLLADLAAYQGALTLADLRRAGITGVNIKVSHGLTDRAVHPRAGEYAQDARTAGMPLSSFHWLTGTRLAVAVGGAERRLPAGVPG